MSVHFHLDRPLEMWPVAGETLTQPPVQFGIARLPHFVADVNPREINVAAAEGEDLTRWDGHPACLPLSGHTVRMLCDRRQARRLSYVDFIDPSALLFFLRVAGVEHHAIARLDRREQMDENFPALDTRHFTEIDTALFTETGVDKFLIVDAAEPAGVKPAREGHLYFITRSAERGMRNVFRDCVRSEFRVPSSEFIERPAVNPCDVRDVLRGFESALNLERRYPSANQIGQHLQARQILRAEQVTLVAERNRFAVGNQIIGQATSLSAFAAIGGTAAKSFAGQTLAGISHAQRAVDEDFQRKRRVVGWVVFTAWLTTCDLRPATGIGLPGLNLLDFFQRTL